MPTSLRSCIQLGLVHPFAVGVVKLALSYWALKPQNLAHPAQVDRPARPGWLGKWLATARVKAQLIDFWKDECEDKFSLRHDERSDHADEKEIDYCIPEQLCCSFLPDMWMKFEWAKVSWILTWFQAIPRNSPHESYESHVSWSCQDWRIENEGFIPHENTNPYQLTLGKFWEFLCIVPQPPQKKKRPKKTLLISCFCCIIHGTPSGFLQTTQEKWILVAL